MPRSTITYSEILRRKPAPKKIYTTSPLKVVECNRAETKHPVPHTPTSSSSSDSCVDDCLPLFPPRLPVKATRNDHYHDLDFAVYVKLRLPSHNSTPAVKIHTNRKASIDAVYIPPPPLAKPYVDKLLGPKSTGSSREFGEKGSTNRSTLSTFDPFKDDPEGSTRSPPPSYRLPISELLPRKKYEPDGKVATDSSLIQPSDGTSSPSTQSPDHSLTGLFLQHGVEPSVYYLPPGLFNEEDESYPACGTSCLAHHLSVSHGKSSRDHRDSNNRSPSSASSHSSQPSSPVSHTDYTLSPTISSASSTYSEDHSLHPRRKPVVPKCCVVKFNSPDTIGVSLEAVLSKKKDCLIDPRDEVMEDWGGKGKPAYIHLIISRNGFKRVFPIQIRCPCGVATRAELAYEIADIMQRYLVEVKAAKSKTDSGCSISGLYLLSLRTDNQGLSWRATFADRSRIKTMPNDHATKVTIPTI